MSLNLRMDMALNFIKDGKIVVSILNKPIYLDVHIHIKISNIHFIFFVVMISKILG